MDVTGVVVTPGVGVAIIDVVIGVGISPDPTEGGPPSKESSIIISTSA